MQKIRFSKVIQLILVTALAGATGRAVVSPTEEAAKLLPDRIGSYKAIGRVRALADHEDNFKEVSAGERDYQSAKGERFTVTLVKHASDSGAYARFNDNDDPSLKSVPVGTLGYASPKEISFFKGSISVAVKAPELPDYSGTLEDFAQQFAETLDKGEGEIPALVKHLPGWQSGDLRSSYVISMAGLKADIPAQPVVDAISFEGGVEAVSAKYGPARLVIVEFNTPQLATDNNGHIVAKIQELKNQGQPTPTAYRRVGNYGVFVFDAPTPEAANQLIDQVKYQQVVQWLGENPFSYEKATREFTETTLGVFVSVVKASGLALVTCLAVGGLFGAVLFRIRRNQQRDRAAYADSDAMLRLNLDELTPETDPARLLPR